MSSNSRLVRRAALGTVSHVLGSVMLVMEFVFFGLLTPVHAIPAARPHIDAFGRVVVACHRWRLVTFLNYDDHLYVVPDWRRTHSYVVRRFVLGSVATAILGLIILGGTSAAIVLWQVLRGEPIGGGSGDGRHLGSEWYEVVAVGAIALVLMFVAVWGLIGVAVLERTVANQYLGPSEAELLRRRVAELSDTRAAVVEAVNGERRRIERDLHDGVQQRLVALGMLLGRALRTNEPEHATRLLRQAHEESQQALNDLREVTWRVYPTALDKDGLHAALEGVADRASVPVWLRYELDARPDLATETVVYFVASEAVTNALKHGRAAGIEIVVDREHGEVVVTVRDDGCGGADVTGSGLSGLASRVAAADGAFRVVSPVGGPTVVTARLPERVLAPS
ncbi:sensor histidine kinase [Actinophytocola oryzae]|uniref:histidine kinase n=1 Tax=Actinophytocola oryzae TaxID=502181 RepID=A0A4R7VXR6_9PSEU|nr:histidine kinase [Actinophytocola oryzae]TDV54007.1 signal transduction histidine kinase [Actinophytocola oryzae]